MMYPDNFDTLNRQSRKAELRNLCETILKLSYEHFSPAVSISLYKKEINKIERKYPQLKVFSHSKPSNETASYCTIQKKPSKK